jgi:hypothetical protein
VAIAKGQNLPARVPPLTNVASVHNEHVLKYFLNAGVPANEVGGVHVTTSMAGSGTKSQSGLDGINGELVAYTTHLERYVDGVPVSGSQAWASFNNRGEVISEGVYWPAISQEVVLRARRIRGIVENADAHARLRAAIKSKIPSLGNEPGRAVITHTHSAYDGPVAVQAAYEVIPAGEGSSVRRFDENGDALPDLGLPAVPPKDPGRP